MEANADPLVGLLQNRTGFRVLIGQQMGQHLNNSHIHAIAGPYVGKFDANGTTANDDGLSRQLFGHNGFFVGNNLLAVNSYTRD